eukprot:TRINITY_DN1986_c0_g1_i4.p3 TRINITY_DN1986_c0_g1~~TRINITY_DN1986_c0_g1_i4.p3  ORF type:complete len:179 (+),score=28.67 TRINITY_DN1986_c0_g1_i4:287-823(+)
MGRGLPQNKTTSRKPAHVHPPYETMVAEALTSLKERTGSSSIAIGKYMAAKRDWDLPENFTKQLSIQLKRMVTDGKLKKVKASYKLGDAMKAKVAKEGKAAPAKRGATKVKTAIKVSETKKPAAKVAKKPASKPPAAPRKAPMKRVAVKKTETKKPAAISTRRKAAVRTKKAATTTKK